MKRKERKYLSVEGEPALMNGERPELDPSEAKADQREREAKKSYPTKIDAIRDSVLSEPSIPNQLRQHLDNKSIEFRN